MSEMSDEIFGISDLSTQISEMRDEFTQWPIRISGIGDLGDLDQEGGEH